MYMCVCVCVCVLHKAKVGREVANLFAFNCHPLPHNIMVLSSSSYIQYVCDMYVCVIIIAISS